MIDYLNIHTPDYVYQVKTGRKASLGGGKIATKSKATGKFNPLPPWGVSQVLELSPRLDCQVAAINALSAGFNEVNLNHLFNLN